MFVLFHPEVSLHSWLLWPTVRHDYYLSCTTERKVKLLSSLILYICSKIPPASLLSTLEYAYVRTYLYSFDIPGQRNNLLFIEKVTTMHITCPCLMGRIGGIGLVLIPFTLKNAHL